jgi:hypothetical protein
MANPRLRTSISGGKSNSRLLFAGFLLLASLAAIAMGLSPAAVEAQGKIAAPELLGGAGWLGTDQPIFLKQLRGKVVILEFWTEC